MHRLIPKAQCCWKFFAVHLFFLEISNLAGLQLQGKLVCNKRDEFRIRGFSLGIAYGIAEKSLQRIQVASVPGNLNGMADGALHAGRRGLESLCHLGIKYLGDGISLACGQQEGVAGATQKGKICEWLIALFVAHDVLSSSGL